MSPTASDKLPDFSLMQITKFVVATVLSASALFAAPLRVAIIGLEHGHVTGFLNGGSALVPMLRSYSRRPSDTPQQCWNALAGVFT